MSMLLGEKAYRYDIKNKTLTEIEFKADSEEKYKTLENFEKYNLDKDFELGSGYKSEKTFAISCFAKIKPIRILLREQTTEH